MPAYCLIAPSVDMPAFFIQMFLNKPIKLHDYFALQPDLAGKSSRGEGSCYKSRRLADLLF
ncbi:MAG: hypothetical protein DA330_01765 [Nitrososphaera sp.]|nr:hypothetical protein [Nitrososphaera sp.]